MYAARDVEKDSVKLVKARVSGYCALDKVTLLKHKGAVLQQLD